MIRATTQLMAALAVLLMVNGAAAQSRDTGWPPAYGDLRFAVEVAGVPEAGGGGRVDITYEVTHDELIFVRHGDGFRARFEIVAILYGPGNRQAAGDSWVRTVTVSDYAETNSRKASVRETVSLATEPGDYRLKIEMRSLDTRSTGTVERRVEVPGLTGSDLTLGTMTFEKREGEGEEQRFAPNPSRVYGVRNPVARLRIPVYGAVGAGYLLSVDIAPEGDELEEVFSDSVEQTEWLTEHFRDIDVQELEVGSYVVMVRLEPEAGGEERTARSRFRVLTSPRSWGEDFEKMIAQIGYVASRDEVDRLVDAAPEDREAAWEMFWDGRDPTPGTAENEFRTEFLRRVGYANVHFRSMIEGWQTDMGRIYIQHGDPDDIESQPIGASLNAWEVWYYYSDHTKYTFVDRDGFGEFRLVDTSRI